MPVDWWNTVWYANYQSVDFAMIKVYQREIDPWQKWQLNTICVVLYVQMKLIIIIIHYKYTMQASKSVIKYNIYQEKSSEHVNLFVHNTHIHYTQSIQI